jgi:hypothetical protein
MCTKLNLVHNQKTNLGRCYQERSPLPGKRVLTDRLGDGVDPKTTPFYALVKLEPGINEPDEEGNIAC